MKVLFQLSLIILLGSCARISSPMGGPEDETPPTLLRSVPDNGQTNYKGNTILLTFDERIQTQSIETNLIITPKPPGSFKTKINKKNLLLTFLKPFAKNTTYSFAFAGTIQDITNRNPATNVSLSFSTGTFIDSLTIRGRIIDLYTQEPAENVLVSLYTAWDSLNILTGSAAYYSKTDTTGKYQFKNLPVGEYRLYANRDKNNNSKADSKEEKYGFYPDTLCLDKSLSEINFTIQNLSTTKLRKLSARHFGRYYDIKFNKAITSFDVLSQPKPVFNQIEKDKVRLYRQSENFNDTTVLIFAAQDSLKTSFIDTVNYYFIESKLKPEAFNFDVAPNRNGLIPNDSLVLTFTKPVKQISPDSMYYQLDSISFVPVDTSKFKWSQHQTKLFIPISIKTLLQGKYEKATLKFKKSAFISVENDSSAQEEKNIFLLNPAETAVISGTIRSLHKNVIVQLIDSRSLDVIRQTYNKNYRFEYLPAGRYMVRAIADLNQNGKWDTGNLLNNEIPEPCKFYFDNFYDTKVIEVRKNWEQSDANISLNNEL